MTSPAPLHAAPAPAPPPRRAPETDQRRASNPESSVWVSASAGSGKTKVLADRIIRLLLAGVAPQKILGLTFTRAAAAEMAVRLSRQLARWATCGEDQLRADLDALQDSPPTPAQLRKARQLFARVLDCPGGLRLRTLHAFGQEILRRFPLEAGLPPHFTPLEERDSALLWQEARDALLQDAARAPDSAEGRALRILVANLGEAPFDALLREAASEPARLAKALEGFGGMEGLAAGIRSFLGLGPTDTEDAFRRRALTPPELPEAALREAVPFLRQGSAGTDQKNARKLADWLALPPEARARNFPDYRGIFLTQDLTIRRTLVTKALAAKHPFLAALFEKEAARLLSLAERLEAAGVADRTEALLLLATRQQERYDSLKAARAALDYDDMIRRANALLRRPGIAPWVLYKLDGGVDHILLDEAQDTSPEQWDMVEALTDEFFAGESARAGHTRTLFVVGDPKQSIYGFLKADPREFERRRIFFRERARAAGQAWDEVPLTTSFRSSRPVLEAVDAVFARDSAREGVAPEPTRHHAWRRDDLGGAERWPLVVPARDDPNDDDSDAVSGGETPETAKASPGKTRSKAAQDWVLPLGTGTADVPALRMAEKVADAIGALCACGMLVYDRHLGQARPLAPRDVIVLTQTRTAFSAHLVRLLKRRRIPVSGVDRMVLTDQLAVMDLVALLNVLLLPEDDLTLATVLKGPLIGLDENQLMDLALGRGKRSLWTHLGERAAADGSPFAPARRWLMAWLDATDRLSPFDLLARVLVEPCPADPTGSGRRAMLARLGPDADDPLNEILNAAQDHADTHGPSLQAFLRWLTATDSQIKREMETPAGHGPGQVRLMTVHAAKGLEAPVVFLPDAARLPGQTKPIRWSWHEAPGLPTPGVPLFLPTQPFGGQLTRLRESLTRRQMEEYRRLLYVALTRAADRLIVGGWLGKKQKEGVLEETWYGLMAAARHGDGAPAFPETSGGLVPAPAETPEAAPAEEPPVPPAPAWLNAPPPPEPSPPRPLAPSRATETEPAAASPNAARFARGRILHRLLQSLPDVPDARREEAARRFLANPQHGLAPEDQEEMREEVLTLLRHPDVAPLFGPDSQAEVPLTGFWGDRVVAGQVDRLCARGEEVWVVDYKTNRPPPATPAEVPPAYRRQMEAYRAILAQIYPGKRIRAALLWTYGPRFMPLEGDGFTP